MGIVGIDSVVFTRKKVSVFEGLLGVAVTADDNDAFKKEYDACIEATFDKLGVPRKKRVYKAAHLAYQLKDKSLDFLKLFFEGMRDAISHIDFFYTFYKTEKTPMIYIYQDMHPRGLPPVDFLHLIENGYEHICAWRYADLYPANIDYHFQIDHFEGKRTPAWKKVDALKDLSIYYSGSECNAVIATADLALRVVQNHLMGSLNAVNIKACFSQEYQSIIGAHLLAWKKDFLNNMAPDAEIDILTAPKVSHPIYFIMWKNLWKIPEGEIYFEWEQFYCKIMERAFENGGCVKKFTIRDATTLLDEKQDYLIVANEGFEEEIRALKLMHPSIRVISRSDNF